MTIPPDVLYWLLAAWIVALVALAAWIVARHD